MAFLMTSPKCYSLGGLGGGTFLNPEILVLHPVATLEQALPRCELRRRRTLPRILAGSSQTWVPSRGPFGQGPRLQDEHLETSDASSGRPVLRPAVEGERTLPHSEHHVRREAPGTHADSVQARTSPRAPSGRSCSLYVEHLEAYYLSPETPASLPAAWMESTLPYYQHLYWRGAPGAPVDFSRECLRTKLLATRWAS